MMVGMLLACLWPTRILVQARFTDERDERWSVLDRSTCQSIRANADGLGFDGLDRAILRKGSFNEAASSFRIHR